MPEAYQQPYALIEAAAASDADLHAMASPALPCSVAAACCQDVLVWSRTSRALVLAASGIRSMQARYFFM